MLGTNHWSATQYANCPEYHVSTYPHAKVPQDLNDAAYHYLYDHAPGSHPQVDHILYSRICSFFSLSKNDPLAVATEYGTFRINHDPRDGSADIEVAACSMGGEHVGMQGPWGMWPFTAAHAVYLGFVNARICHLKGLDPLASFDASVAPDRLQNGPIYVWSTHAERAIQTQDWGFGAASKEQSDKYGYFAGSGDPDMRWDLAVLDVRDAHLMKADPDGSYDTAKATALKSASIIRSITHAALVAGFPDGMWNLDK